MVPIFSNHCLGTLQRSMYQNRLLYRNGHFDIQDQDTVPLTGVDFNEGVFNALDMRSPRSEQATVVFRSFPGLTPAHALNPRFWSYVCHTYARAKIIDNATDESLRRLTEGNNDKLSAFITPRFFPNTILHFRSRNPISKMWWNYKTAEVSCQENVNDDWTLERALCALTRNVEVNQQLIEKRTFSRGHKFTKAILMELELLSDRVILTTRPNDDGSQGLMQQFLIRINGMSGHLFLPAMTVQQIRSAISSIKTNLGISLYLE